VLSHVVMKAKAVKRKPKEKVGNSDLGSPGSDGGRSGRRAGEGRGEYGKSNSEDCRGGLAVEAIAVAGAMRVGLQAHGAGGARSGGRSLVPPALPVPIATYII
jgi:hypothetical protein